MSKSMSRRIARHGAIKGLRRLVRLAHTDVAYAKELQRRYASKGFEPRGVNTQIASGRG